MQLYLRTLLVLTLPLLELVSVAFITTTISRAEAATVFFTYAINQMLYAEHARLLPWVSLDPRHVRKVYDAAACCPVIL